MARVTQEDIIHINDVYYKCRTYAETARQTGFSASTVKKYVISGYEPAEAVKVEKFDRPLPKFDPMIFVQKDDWASFCEYTVEEAARIEELWKEMAL